MKIFISYWKNKNAAGQCNILLFNGETHKQVIVVPMGEWIYPSEADILSSIFIET